MRKKNQGFTLIELVVVISIIGILVATALPRFSGLQSQARIAKQNGALAAIRAAAALAHATQITQNMAPNITVSLEGQNINMVNGYPAATHIGIAAGLSTANPADYFLSLAGNSVTITPSATHVNCSIIYTEALAINEQPTYNNTSLTLENCS